MLAIIICFAVGFVNVFTKYTVVIINTRILTITHLKNEVINYEYCTNLPSYTKGRVVDTEFVYVCVTTPISQEFSPWFL